MPCHLCEPFLNDLVNEDFGNWRYVESGWYTYKFGNFATVKAAGEAGCEVCSLFNHVRAKQIPDYDRLGEKWLAQASSIDYDYEHERQQALRIGNGQPLGSRARWTFNLLTVLPEMSRIAFEIFNPSLPPSSTEKNSVTSNPAYRVSASAASGPSTAIASSWLSECTNSHSHCRRLKDKPLPTRVLDIQKSGDSFAVRLQVNNGQIGQYVTLSHCWGAKERLTLLESNLPSFQQSIRFEDLTLTFQDAVRLTAALGQRYLWIDALCIVQKDQKDWEREAASMYAVFENALFSISALAAEDSHSGLLQDRQSAHTLVNAAGTSIGVRETLPSLEEALRISKLETRAWCLQERLLSPRILHVAPGQLHWECRTFILSETCPFDPLKNDSGQASRPFTAGSVKPVALERKDQNHHAHWLTLVGAYSRRELTDPSDRLPAISGLAEKAMHELGLGTCIHGLWLDNIPSGLLWQCDNGGRNGTKGKSGRLVSCPSWSWAAADGPIRYPLLEDIFAPQSSKRDLILERRHVDDTRESSSSSKAQLSVIGIVKRGACKRAAAPSTLGTAMFRAPGSLLVDEALSCVMDSDDEMQSQVCHCLLVGVFENDTPAQRKGHQEQRSGYLILRRVESYLSQASSEVFGTFKRIGMGFDRSQVVDKVFANAECQRLELVRARHWICSEPRISYSLLSSNATTLQGSPRNLNIRCPKSSGFCMGGK